MKHLLLVFIILGGFSLTIMGWSWLPQEKPAQPETLPLVPMMQQLLSDVQQVDRGIYTENFAMIEKGAGNISDHPTMTPEDKKLVKQTLGKEMKQFVKFDMIVHHHADSMRMAAVEENMQQVLKHYRITQQGCVDCHSNYRDKISTARVENQD
jgi:cytochrome c556